MKNLIIWGGLVLLGNLFTSQVFGQIHGQIMEELNTRDFDSIVEACTAYFEAHPEMEKERMQFNRWADRNVTRLTPDGKVHNYVADAYFKRKEYDHLSSFHKAFSEPHGNWVNLGPKTSETLSGSVLNELGRVNCIVQDPANPNILYLGAASGGIWKSTNYGGSWVSTGDDLPTLAVQSIAIDPNSPTTNRTIYLQTGDRDSQDGQSYGVLKSTDGGDTWFRIYETMSNPNGIELDPNNSSRLIVAYSSGLYETLDGGQTWNTLISGNTHSFAFKPGSSNVMYAGYSNGYRYSTDFGDTWTNVPWSTMSGTISISSSNETRLAVTADNPNVLYVFGLTGNWAHTFKSTNSGVGASFRSRVLINPQSGYNFCGAVASYDESLVFIGGVSVRRSTNSGSSYSVLGGVHADHHFLTFLKPNVSGFNDFLWSGNDGGAASYFNLGIINTWVNRTKNACVTQLYGMDVNKRTDRNTPAPVFGTQDNGSHLLVGSLGRKINGGDGIECLHSRQTGSKEIYATVQNGIIRKFDYSVAPMAISTNTPTNSAWQTGSWPSSPFHTYISQHPYNTAGYTEPDILFAAQKDVWVNTSSSHLASHWHPISNLGIPSTPWVTNVTGSPLEKCVMVASFDRKLFVTTSSGGCSLGGGQSWVERTPPGWTHNITDIVCSETNMNTFWICAGGLKRVYKTTDRGLTWEDITGSLPLITVNTIETDGKWNNGLYVGTDAGIFYRNDQLGDWIPFDNGLPVTTVEELDYDPIDNRLYAGTYGRGIWRSEEYSGSCVNFYSFSGSQSGTEVYAAYDYIHSTSDIDPMSSIRYTARNEVRLKPGFKVKATDITPTQFRAHISDICTNGSLMNKIKGIYVDGQSVVSAESATEEPVAVQISDKGYNVYPNPTTRNLNVESTDGTDFELDVFNSLNQKVANQNSTNGRCLVNLQQVRSGVIFIRIRNSEGELTTHKIVKL